MGHREERSDEAISMPNASPSHDGAPAIAVHDLTRNFGAFVAVDHVSFEVGRGEVFGFLGPNGAGKTTTIKMLAGLLAPTAGEAHVAGLDVAREPEAVKQRIGYMSQLFSLYGDLTVEENIIFFGGLYGLRGKEREERRDWVLRMAGLEAARARLVRELALGFKQRLALGCAVLHRPPILFLDEPTSGVDPLSRRTFWDLIHELARGGTTVLVSTHYMEEAEYCHRLALMNRGKLVALDTPPALRQKLGAPILEVRAADAPAAVEALQAEDAVRAVGLFGRALHVTVDEAARGEEAVRRRLRDAGIAVESLRRIPPSLEDVFVALVQESGGAMVS
ncbi:MAG TPA: ABC transporter ATP-binding protein [Thermoanaerobaculia bacterium]|jgi:ABC-2 type transport system ATP-binding protein|nr:ABC transporter ATP-binding protein [Thermoanaerobaculia bacterium]